MPRRAIQRAGDIKNKVSSAIKRGQRFREDEEQNEQNQNILDEFGVDIDIIVGKNILLPETVDAVVFSESEPRGFNYDDVEAFVEEAKTSIEYYIQLISDKNWGIRKLATEINENRTNIEDLKYQLQIHRGKGVAQVDDDGNYLTEESAATSSGDANTASEELSTLEAELTERENENQALQEELSKNQETIEALQYDLQEIQKYADELEEYINAITEGSDDEYEDSDEEYEETGEEAQADGDDLWSDDDYYDEYDETALEAGIPGDDLDDEEEVSAQQQLEELSAWGDEMEAALRAMEEQNNELQEALDTAQAQIDELKESGQVQDQRDDIIEELTNDNLAIREQFKISEGEKEELYARYEEAVEIAQTQETHINELNDYIDQLEKENQKLVDKANNVRVELDSDRYPTKQVPQPKQTPQQKTEPKKAPLPKREQPKKEEEPKRRVMFSADDLLAPEVDS